MKKLIVLGIALLFSGYMSAQETTAKKKAKAEVAQAKADSKKAVEKADAKAKKQKNLPRKM